MAPSSDEGPGYKPESGSNFGESNYSDEATERRSKIRKLLKHRKSEKSSVRNLRIKCCNATKAIQISKQKEL